MNWVNEYESFLQSKKIVLLATPVQKSKKATHKCLVCEHVWEVKPYNVLKMGTGCPECGKRKNHENLRARGELSFRENVARLGQFRIVGPYSGLRVPVEVECLKCKRRYERDVHYLQKESTKCGFCFPKSGRPVSTEARDRLIAYCATQGIEVLNYTSTNKKSKFRCKKGHVWEARASSLEAGSGCPTCAVKFSVAYTEVKVGRRSFQLQGYEGIALKWMIKHAKVPARAILAGRTEVQKFRYRYHDKSRLYFPDFQVGEKIVEVKSMWTAGLTHNGLCPDAVSFEKLKAKAQAVMDAGFQFRLLLLDRRGERMFKASIPTNWTKLSKEKMINAITWEEFEL